MNKLRRPTVSNTALLEETEPLDEVMVAGIDRFALKNSAASQQRIKQWDQDVLQAENQSAAFKQKRAELSQLIGCIDAQFLLTESIWSPKSIDQH